MSMDRYNQLHEPQEQYQRRRIRAYIKDIPKDKRQEVLEKILARTILGGDTPCKNALETALKELKEKEKRKPGRPRKVQTPKYRTTCYICGKELFEGNRMCPDHGYIGLKEVSNG